jgi:hypothetical protein
LGANFSGTSFFPLQLGCLPLLQGHYITFFPTLKGVGITLSTTKILKQLSKVQRRRHKKTARRKGFFPFGLFDTVSELRGKKRLRIPFGRGVPAKTKSKFLFRTRLVQLHLWAEQCRRSPKGMVVSQVWLQEVVSRIEGH